MITADIKGCIIWASDTRTTSGGNTVREMVVRTNDVKPVEVMILLFGDKTNAISACVPGEEYIFHVSIKGSVYTKRDGTQGISNNIYYFRHSSSNSAVDAYMNNNNRNPNGV